MSRSNNKPEQAWYTIGSNLFVVAVGVVILIVLAVALSRLDDPSSEGKEKAKPIAIRATDLYEEYKADRVAADAKYRSKLLAVSGTIKSIDKTLNEPHIQLSHDRQISRSVTNATFPESRTRTLINLETGQKVTIIGTCDGFSSDEVLLKTCYLK